MKKDADGRFRRRAAAAALGVGLLAVVGCSEGTGVGEEKALPPLGNGAWLWWRTVDRYGVDEVLDRLEESGVRHLFVLGKSGSGEVRQDHLVALLPQAHARGMFVHVWFVCFRDELRDPSWVDPASAEYRRYLLETISRFLDLRASGHAVDGVHLDYVRYRRDAPGTEAVTSFVAEVRELLDRRRPRVVLSAATKAESFETAAGVAASARFYGQSYADLARYVDWFCPMTYHLDYGVPPAKAAAGAALVAQITGRPVLAGIQLHEGPGGRGPTPAEVREGLEAARARGLPGVVFFRAEYLVTRPEYREAARSVSFGKGP